MINLFSDEKEEYYIPLPEACPLDGAYRVKENLTVYRIVENAVPSDSDFQPLGVNPKKQYFKRRPETYCKSLALSVIQDLAEAEVALSGMSERYAATRFLAKGVITTTCGKIKNTPGPIGESHVSWWPFIGVVPCSSFNVVGGVSSGL